MEALPCHISLSFPFTTWIVNMMCNMTNNVKCHLLPDDRKQIVCDAQLHAHATIIVYCESACNILNVETIKSRSKADQKHTKQYTKSVNKSMNSISMVFNSLQIQLMQPTNIYIWFIHRIWQNHNKKKNVCKKKKERKHFMLLITSYFHHIERD